MQPPKSAAASPAHPFSHPFRVDARHEFPVAIKLVASEGERAAIARALDIPAIAALTASLKVARGAGGRFIVSGDLDARLTRVCVVSLDPFEIDVHEPIRIDFARIEEPRTNDPAARTVDVHVEDGDEPPDPLVDGTIDLGAVVTEFLALALDPHPRKPGVDFQPGSAGDEPAPSPFAALGRLKDKLPSKKD
jgi:uncharacterized metal-binding protein YceD (DUF177 family)